MISDELSDANETVQQERRARGAAGDGSDAAASGIRNVAQRIESIASRIETS
jgi:hypothetical protein